MFSSEIITDQGKKYLPKNVAIYISVIACVIGITFGVFITKGMKNPSTSHETRLREQYKFINPLLECDTEFNDAVFPNAIKETLNNYINAGMSKKEFSTAAVYYRDLNNGPWFGINQSSLFTPASLIKVPIMMVYYKKAEVDPSVLNQLLEVKEFVPSVSQEGEFAPDKTLTVGNKYTVDDLITHMIIYSDNTAYKTLKDNLTIAEFNGVFSDLGIDIVPLETNPTEKVLSLIEYSSLFRVLYNSSYLSRQYSEKALRLLSEVVYTKGIRAGVPENVDVSHKFGERSNVTTNEKQLHDCGIIYAEKSPYLLCVMTRGNAFSQLSNALKEISKLTYDAVGRNVKND